MTILIWKKLQEKHKETLLVYCEDLYFYDRNRAKCLSYSRSSKNKKVTMYLNQQELLPRFC